MKVAFFGLNINPNNINYSGMSMLQGVSNCKVFVPANGKWNDFEYNAAGNNEAIYYGANTNLNLIVDDDAGKITAIPTDSAALAKVLEVAPTLKTYLGWDTHITVTNMIEVAAGVITAENANWIHSFNSLVFKVDTQTYLNTLVDAIPSSVPFAINPCDATEDLVLPQGREIYVRISSEGRDGKYRPKIVRGMVIKFQ